jgi:hypothetical protein
MTSSSYRRSDRQLSGLDILNAGMAMLGEEPWRRNIQTGARINRFKACYGSHPYVYARIWRDLEVYEIDHERKLGYYLMTLFWMKGYDTEAKIATIWRRDEETVRAWCWYYAECIQTMFELVVQLPKNLHADLEYPLIVDGVHCRIFEPGDHPTEPFDSKFSSKKFGKKAALAYEVAVSTTEQRIYSVRGPFPAGEFTDLVMFRDCGLQDWLIKKGKKAFADAIYVKAGKGVSTPCTQYDSKPANQYKRKGRAKVESINSRLKNFGVLNQIFRHKIDRMSKHKTCFQAVTVIVAYQLQSGSPLFEL